MKKNGICPENFGLLYCSAVCDWVTWVVTILSIIFGCALYWSNPLRLVGASDLSIQFCWSRWIPTPVLQFVHKGLENGCIAVSNQQMIPKSATSSLSLWSSPSSSSSPWSDMSSNFFTLHLGRLTFVLPFSNSVVYVYVCVDYMILCYAMLYYAMLSHVVYVIWFRVMEYGM